MRHPKTWRTFRPGKAWLWLVAGGVLLAGVLPGGGCAESPDSLGSQPVERVLIVSLPGVDWDDVQDEELPNLESFVETAAIADMSTRIGRRNARTTDAYLTIGAGTRAVAPPIDVAVAMDPDDTYGGVPTAEFLERRLGYVPSGIAYLASGAARDVNDQSAFGAEVGLLGDTLNEAKVSRGVIANADALEGFVDESRPPDGYYARSAATALMGSDGIVPSGTVGRTLLVDDPDAPFGRRLDHDAVMRYFDGIWNVDGRRVVLVEASDLARASAYRGRSTPSQRDTLREDALSTSDELLGRLLEEVDPAHDAVIVVSPVSPTSTPELGIAALRAPGVDTGLLQSPTTRRDGYVQLADVAPTVLALLGEEHPSEMEGRSFRASNGVTGNRIDHLVGSARAAALRDGFLPTVVTTIIIVIGLLFLAMVYRGRLSGWVQSATVVVAFGVLGAVPGTFLTEQFEFAHGSRAGHALVILGVAAAIAVVAALIERVARGWGVIFAVATVVAVIAGDILSGARLQVNTVFGYSVAVAGRFIGLGNLAYALLGAAGIVLAALIVDRCGRRAIGPVVVLLAFLVLVDGLPMLGADVGGVMSLLPAFGVTVLILAGRPVQWREGLFLAVGAGVTVLAFAFIDAARPDETHTHLARLAQHVLDGRWELLLKTVSRRWQASFGSLELAGWGTILTALTVAWVYAIVQARRRRGRPTLPAALVSAASQPTPVVAALAGLAVLGTIGLVANDSSLAVPLTLLIVAVPVLVARTMSESPAPAEVPGSGAGGGEPVAGTWRSV